MEQAEQKNKQDQLEIQNLEPKVDKAEALQVAEEMRKDAKVEAHVREVKGTLAEFARKMGKPMRVLAFAFSMLLAKEAMADDLKMAKVEQAEINLDLLKAKFEVPNDLRSLAEYEDPVAGYVAACDRVVFMADHLKDMISSEKEVFLKNAKQLVSPKEVQNVSNAEGRMYFLNEYSKQINALNSVGGEIESRIEQGYTISDIAQNGE